MNTNDSFFQPDLGEIDDEEENGFLKLNDNNSDTVNEVPSTSVDSVEPEKESTPSLGTQGKEVPVVTAYTCPFCNTVFSTRSEVNATYCVYCGSRGVTKLEERPMDNTYIIPFVDTMKDAIAAYKKKIRFNPVIPLSFRSGKMMKKIRKVYLVCTLYDFGVGGNIIFQGADRVSKVKNAPMQMYECMYSTNIEYNNILASNYFRIADEILCSINHYNFSVMREFNTNLLNDAFLIHGNIDKEDVTRRNKDKVEKHVLGVVRGVIPHDLKKVTTNNAVVGVASSKTVLIPLYILNAKYNNDKYFFYMNGQTGEVVSELPSSFLSVALFSVVVFTIVFLLVFLLAHLI